jgi:hypothetical protein
MGKTLLYKLLNTSSSGFAEKGQILAANPC